MSRSLVRVLPRIVGVGALLVSLIGPGRAVAQGTSDPAAAQTVLLPEQLYQPGVYDSGPIPLPPGSAGRQHLVCVLSTGAPVDVGGEVLFSTDGGTAWQEWAPFAMSVGDTIFDNKRNQWLQPPDSCAGATATDTSGWTHVRLFINLANAPAFLSATLADLSAPAGDADPASTPADPPGLPQESETP